MRLYPGKKSHYSVILVYLLIFPGFSQTTVTIDIKNAKSVIAPEVFGVLMERLGRQWTGLSNSGIFVGTTSSIPNIDGIRRDIIEGFKECGVGAIEWPGGLCAGNGYSWEKNKKPSNDVGVDRFIQFCKLTGAEAIISLKPGVSDFPSNVAFVQYVVDSLHYPLKWAIVGTDIWGGCGSNYTNEYVASTFPRNVAKLNELRKTETGRDLKIIAAAGAAEGQYSWIRGYYDSIGSQMDAIEYYDYSYYPFGIISSNPTTTNYWTIMDEVFVGDFHKHLFDSIIPPMKAADPSSRVKIAFDQWGSWFKADDSDEWMQDVTMMDAISAAGHLHQFIQNADIVGLACLSQGVNVLQSIMNINRSGIMVKTPVFYVFKLLRPHHSKGAKYCPITESSYAKIQNNIPAVSVVASVDNDHILNVSCVNTDFSATRDIRIRLAGVNSDYRLKSAEVVTGQQYSSKNNFGRSEEVNIQTLNPMYFDYSVNDNILHVRLPANSIVMVRLQEECVCSSKSTKNIIEKKFSIRAGSDGMIHISSSEMMQTPVIINIYTADGKSLVYNSTRVIGTCKFSIGNNLSKGAYLVRISGRTINFKQLVIIAE
jgi:alpha-N-arabinofuranosidase